MIYPLIPYAIKGAIWYQGEANSKTPETGMFYEVQLADLIRSWREVWLQGDFPFYVMQLVNFKQVSSEPVAEKDLWPYTRESMMKVVQKLKNTGMAVGIDIGEANDIHPKNKKEAGRRLALLALEKDYQKVKNGTSPLYKYHRIDGRQIIVSFESVGSGLVAKEGKLRRFAIAGADGQYVSADAEIASNGYEVIVSSEQVEHPVSVRYAWADNPEGANLYSKEGLPASPFRTDY